MQLLCCSRVFMHRRTVSAPFQHCDEAITIYEPIILHRGVFLMDLFVLCWKTYKLNTTYDEKDFLCKDPWSRHWSPNCFDKSVWVHGINPILLWRTSVIKSFWRVYFLPVVSFLFSFLSLCLLQVVNTYSMTVMIREEEYTLKMCDTSGKDKHFCSQFNN